MLSTATRDALIGLARLAGGRVIKRYLLRYLLAARRRARPLLRAVGRLPTPLTPFEAWLAVNSPSARDVQELRAALAERAGRLPGFSIVTPIHDTPPDLLAELADAVIGQIYPHWEWCLADDASPSAHVGPMLADLVRRDPRIRLVTLPRNGGISAATNAAAGLATGDVLAFVDHDDLITPDCLAEMALYYADRPDTDMAYSDDDKIDERGRRYAPQFKPDWSPVLHLAHMYMGHVLTVRRSLFQELGGFRSAFDGSQDYDFALRASERARHVGHVPKILYHWCAVANSTAVSGDAKPASFEAGRLAVEEAVARRGIVVERIIHPGWAAQAKVGMFEIEFPDRGPGVSIIVPTRNGLDLLRGCVESLRRTTYADAEVIVVDNGSDDPDTLAYLATLQGQANTRVVSIPSRGGRFSFAALMNEAARHATGDYLLFLNNDTKVIDPRWLSEMMGYARMPGVGAVGARLYFEDGTIQHAGIVHGYHGGLAGPAFRNAPPHDWGYLGFIRTAREYSAVTAACMLTPRKLFTDIGGFDERDFAVAYNDVDYCYRLVEAGHRCVYCPKAELTHFEGKSRGFDDDPREVAAFRRKYGGWRDRWYNPNLSLANERFEPGAIRPQTRASTAVRVAFATADLDSQGPASFLLDLAVGLTEAGAVLATIVSLRDGPLRQAFEAAGVTVRIANPSPLGFGSDSDLTASLKELSGLVRDLHAEVVLANALSGFWAVTAATASRIPSVWCLHDGERWRNLPRAARRTVHRALAQAYRVLFVSEAMRHAWSEEETRGNFEVIRLANPPERPAAQDVRSGEADFEEMVRRYASIIRQAVALDMAAGQSGEGRSGH